MSFFLHEQIYRNLRAITDHQVTICGAGALGANLAETLARMGLPRLRVIDRDHVEPHNLSTQPWIQQDIGAPKVRALATALYRAVGARVEPQHVELTPENAVRLLADSAVVVDAFDNLAARAAVAEACWKLERACLHIGLGSGGDYGCGLWDDQYRTKNGHPQGQPRTGQVQPRLVLGSGFSVLDACDYPLTRPLALLVAAAAAEALVCHLLDGSRRGFDLTLRDLRLTPVDGLARGDNQ
jgi:molybdopterin-synthase adenylyltransferase